MKCLISSPPGNTLIQVDCCRSTTFCLLPFLYAGGAQWSIHRKVGYVCRIKVQGPLFTSELLDCCFFHEPKCANFTARFLTSVSVFSSSCRMHDRSRLSVCTTELFSSGVYAALFLGGLNRATVCCSGVHNGQSREHKHISV